MRKLIFASFALSLCAAAAAAQTKFEGYNLVVDAPKDHRQPTCAVRYLPAGTTITIADLDTSTPMRLTACDGTTILNSTSGHATIQANATSFKWCFRGEDSRYRVTLSPRGGPPISYIWYSDRDERRRGFYNIRDFGAAGDGRTDDTEAFRSAMAVIASNNGGTLTIPDGDYVVSSPISLPSGIVIHGTNGLHSMASTSDVTRKNPARITLSGSNRALFKIGECVENVTIRDLELYAQSNQETSAIEAAGAYTTSQGFDFERVAFQNFNRGINAFGLPQTNLGWQFDYIRVTGCRFVNTRDTGIFVNIRNTDWKISSTFFTNPRKQPGQNANSMHFERVGFVQIQDTFGGGFPNAKGGTFINILDSGPTTIIGSQTENMTHSIVYNEVENPYAGDYSYPITIVNSIFGDPILFKGRRTLVSTGSLYAADTFTADERVRIYSTGDRFCYDSNTLGCLGARKKNFDRATILFMTGQPDERNVPGHPTVFGTDVQFGGTPQLPSFLQNALPANKPNGTIVYCSNCRRATTPCQAGGTGAPAMVINGQWGCL